MNQKFYEKLAEILPEERIRTDEPMKMHTTFRVGGPADYFLMPESPEEVQELVRLCKKEEVPFYVIGNGSNLLVGDKGIRGLVIEMVSREDEFSIDGETMTVGAGMLLSKAAHLAAGAGLSGMEFAAGIPGSIGGAVVMNAGAYGGEMKDILRTVTVLDGAGREKRLPAEELELGYRKSCILKNGYLVTEAVVGLKKDDREKIRARMEELRQKRIEKQPLEYPSAGSTFKRPEGYFAGKLIMDAGLRGYRVGGAQISEKHCGFVINTGNATASDIRRLMQEVSDEVERQFGVRLEPEVKLLGEF